MVIVKMQDLGFDFYDDEEVEFGFPQPPVLQQKQELRFEFTFKVKEEFAELFWRVQKAVRVCDPFMAQEVRLLQRLIGGINFDTMKINNTTVGLNLLGRDRKKLRKTVKKSLKGKKCGLKNIWEKKADIAFLHMKDVEEIYINTFNHIRCWDSFASHIGLLEVTEIIKRSDGIYCRAEVKNSTYYSKEVFEDMGKFIGTFGDTSSKIEVCYLDDENEPILLEVEEDLPSSITIKALKSTVEKNGKQADDLPEDVIIRFQDVSKVYKVSVNIEVKPELHDLVRAVKEVLQLTKDEELINSYDKLIKEIDILQYNIDIFKRFIDENFIEDLNMYDLRVYEKKQFINRIEHGFMKKVLSDELFGEELKVKYVYLPGKIAEMFEADFFIEESGKDTKITWRFNAEVCGFTEEEIRGYFNQFKDNAVSMEVSVKEK